MTAPTASIVIFVILGGFRSYQSAGSVFASKARSPSDHAGWTIARPLEEADAPDVSRIVPYW